MKSRSILVLRIGNFGPTAATRTSRTRRWLPHETSLVQLDLWLSLGLNRAQHVLDLFGRHAHDILATPVLDDAERGQRFRDVGLSEAGEFGQILNRSRAFLF